jgi:surface protein
MSIISIGIPIPDRSALPGQTGSGEEVNLQYTTQNYCGDHIPNPVSPSVATPTGGSYTFSVTSGGPTLGLVPGDGTVNIQTSNPGSYVVTYTVPGVGSANFPINITAVQDSSFSYSASAFCKDASNQTPTITTPGGSFTTQDITFYPFQLKFDVSAAPTISIPTTGSNFTVDWGDGTVTTETGGTISHSYGSGLGDVIISIGAEDDTGPFTAMAMRQGTKNEFREVVKWGSIQWSTFNQMFRDIPSFQITANDSPDLSLVSSVNTLYLMFYNSNAGNPDLSSWDVSGITNLNNAFQLAHGFNNNSITNWNISSATNMSNMFYQSTFNGDLSGWDTSSVTYMISMFSFGGFNNNSINNWDTSSVITFGNMFGRSGFGNNADLSNWDTSSATDMQSMFLNCSNFNSDISSWDVSNVIDMSNMFPNTQFNADISGWDVSSVVNFKSFIKECSTFNQDISGWNTASLQDMETMFFRTTNFNLNLSGWNILNLTTASGWCLQSGISSDNYTDTVVGWAVQVYNNNNSPTGKNASGNNISFDGTKTSDTQSGQAYNVKYSNWPSAWTNNNAQDAYNYLVNTANWSL